MYIIYTLLSTPPPLPWSRRARFPWGAVRLPFPTRTMGGLPFIVGHEQVQLLHLFQHRLHGFVCLLRQLKGGPPQRFAYTDGQMAPRSERLRVARQRRPSTGGPRTQPSLSPYQHRVDPAAQRPRASSALLVQGRARQDATRHRERQTTNPGGGNASGGGGAYWCGHKTLPTARRSLGRPQHSASEAAPSGRLAGSGRLPPT